MIEPTETESKETLDEFCDAMIQIAREARENPQLIHDAPVTTPVRRLDQTGAAAPAAAQVDARDPGPQGEGSAWPSACHFGSSSPSRWTAPPTWRSTRRSCSRRLRHGSPPTLRFFAWAPPTISLGYGQRLDGRIDVRGR